MKGTIVFFFLFLCFHSHSQETLKDVKYISLGIGNTIEEAKQVALTSAYKHVFEVLIPSYTDFFTEKELVDQLSSISNGNIKNFELLSQFQFYDGRKVIILKSIFSIDSLTSFIKEKGGIAEIKGGIFALNIKQQFLNEQGEIQIITKTMELVHELLQISFDYSLKNGQPKSLDIESKRWEIPLEISVIANENMTICRDLLIKSLESISLSPHEVESNGKIYEQLFPVKIKNASKIQVFNLRKQHSITLINYVFSYWGFYMKNFIVQTGRDEIIGGQIKLTGKFDLNNVKDEQSVSNQQNNVVMQDAPRVRVAIRRSEEVIKPGIGAVYPKRGEEQSVGWQDWNTYFIENSNSVSLNFPTNGTILGLYRWNDIRTLSQIEGMTGYSVKSKGIVSKSFFSTGAAEGNVAGRQYLGGPSVETNVQAVGNVAGRQYRGGPSVETNVQVEGVVTVKIWVDNDGKVLRVRGGVPLTTITDRNIWKLCENNAKRHIFSANPNDEPEKEGTITYRFKLQ
jgi:hypothetical protein